MNLELLKQNTVTIQSAATYIFTQAQEQFTSEDKGELTAKMNLLTNIGEAAVAAKLCSDKLLANIEILEALNVS